VWYYDLDKIDVAREVWKFLDWKENIENKYWSILLDKDYLYAMDFIIDKAFFLTQFPKSVPFYQDYLIEFILVKKGLELFLRAFLEKNKYIKVEKKTFNS